MRCGRWVARRNNSAATACRRRSAISIGSAQDDLTRRYEELSAHYGMTPSRNNRGVAHERTNPAISPNTVPSQAAHRKILRSSSSLRAQSSSMQLSQLLPQRHSDHPSASIDFALRVARRRRGIAPGVGADVVDGVGRGGG